MWYRLFPLTKVYLVKKKVRVMISILTLITISIGVYSYEPAPYKQSGVTVGTIYVAAGLPDLPLPTISQLNESATVHVSAIRLSDFESQSTVETISVGLWDQPFAPEGLSDCDEFRFYRIQWGLPARFDSLAWRESNCRNEDGVRTFCCHGYLQLYISLQIKDHRITDRYHECGVYSANDINSDNPLEKQKHLCAAAVLFSVVGYDAWALG